jgi:transcriptional regulator of acetoin/glycerol metabolism
MKKEIREKSVQNLEKKFLLKALENSSWNISKAWNVSRAAEKTGLQRTNFHALMKKHGIFLPA